MRFYAHEKLAVLVDGANLHCAAQNVGLEIDWGRFQLFFARQATLVTSCYFTPIPAEHQDGFQPLQRLLDWLDYNSWQVIASDTGVDMAVMAMELAGDVDHFVIGSGDGDFVVLAEALKRRGRRVTVLAALKGGGVSDDLRRAADDFLDLEALRTEIARAPRTTKEAVSA